MVALERSADAMETALASNANAAPAAPARKPLKLAGPARGGAGRGSPSGARYDESPWTILVVDDEPEVHAMTRLVLSKLRFRERGVQILSAHSAAEARGILAMRPDVAVILLDVVMETDDAGLKFAREIREDMRNEAVRIVLRTGQPGQAPEEDVIVSYDINDYKAKTELTAQKLFTTVVTALRSYGHIRALEANRQGLERIIDSSSELLTLHSMREFATGVLTQLSAFLGCAPNGILCARNTGTEAGAALRVLAAIGDFECCLGADGGRDGDGPLSPAVSALVSRALESRATHFDEHHTVLYIPSRDGEGTAVLICSPETLTNVDRQLLELFASKISIGFENVMLYDRMEELVAKRTRELEHANRELERLVTLDPLTGARNRRCLMERAAGEMARAQRQGRALSVLAIDLDHFKDINDAHGHAAGDTVLKCFVKRASAILRPSDLIGRTGGEEFVILLPEASRDDALAIAERIRAALATMPVQTGEGPVTVTASFGIAVFGADGTNPEQLMNRADRRLYAAKHAGRNQVVAMDDAVAA